MADLDLADRRVLIREDLNVPISEGRVTSEARILAALPTIRQAMDAGARVMVMSHLGRPREGSADDSLSLAPVAEVLSRHLGVDVPLVRDWLEGVEVESGQVVLCENVRFNAGEKSDDEKLARRMAELCDVFVMDAFGTAHRAEASTHGVARYAPVACAGPLLVAELEALGRAFEHPAHPLLAVVGGAKVSTKLQVLERLSDRVDRLIVGGGIANTFIAAAGHPVGKSLHEPDRLEDARRIMERVLAAGGEIPLPSDVVVADRVAADAPATVKPVADVGAGELILDIGPDTAAAYARLIEGSATVVWNGPVGVFELAPFEAGTRTLAEAMASSRAFSIAGGGDTLAAIDKYGVAERISYISTGGGAFLEFLEGRTLPAVAVLEQRAG